MFERFTQKARDVVTLAREEAEQGGVDYVGTEHLLLAMLAKGDGRAFDALTAEGLTLDGVRTDVARLLGTTNGRLGAQDAEALKTIGIDLDAVVASVEQSFGPGALSTRTRGKRRRFGPAMPFTKRAKKVLELALREAVRLKHNYIGTEHLLLGLIREGEGLAASIMVEKGISLPDLRQRVESEIRAAA